MDVDLTPIRGSRPAENLQSHRANLAVHLFINPPIRHVFNTFAGFLQPMYNVHHEQSNKR